MKKKQKKQEKKKKVFRRQEIPQEKYMTVVCTAIEEAEAKLTLSAMNKELINKWAYVSDDGKISGLTYWGYLACAEGADKGKWTPVYEEPKVQVLSGTRALLIIPCTNPKTRVTKYGTCTFDINERFGDRKADTIARRRGLQAHIKLQQVIAFTQYVLAFKPENVLKITQGDMKKAKAETMPEDTAKNKVMREIFAKIAALGLETKRMHAYLRKTYKTKHLKDLKDEQLEEIKKGLVMYAKKESLLLDLKEHLKQMPAADLKEWGGDDK